MNISSTASSTESYISASSSSTNTSALEKQKAKRQKKLRMQQRPIRYSNIIGIMG